MDRLKFNLVMIAVFVIGLGVAGFMSYELLHRNARDEVLRNAGVMMEAALSMRGYTVGKVRPLLPYDPDKFLPESVPAFAATEIMHLLQKKYPDYSYKEAALNPTNPRNRAVDWESDDESRTLASFRHPNIVRVMRFFEAKGGAYMVMEYVEGDALPDCGSSCAGRSPKSRSTPLPGRSSRGCK